MRELDRVLRSTRRHLAWATGLRQVAIVLTVAIVASVVALILDARWSLPMTARITIDLIVVGLVVTAVFHCLLAAGRAAHMDLRRVAREAEMSSSVSHSAIINAVSVGRAERADYTSTQLTEQVIEIGDSQAHCVQPRRVAPWASARNAIALLVLASLLASLALFAVPRLWTFGWPRFADPTHDHPSFTWLDFQFETTPTLDAISLGDDVSVRVSIEGRGIQEVSEATISVIDTHGETLEERVMQSLGTAQFGHTLNDLRAPVRLAVRTARGESSFLEVNPNGEPRIRRAHAVIVDPPYADNEPRVEMDLGIALGSTVHGQTRVSLESNVDLSSVEIESTLTGEIAIDADAPRFATVTFPSDRLGTYFAMLRLVGADGLVSDDELSLRLDIKPDLPPEVQIVEPGGELLAHTTQQIPLAVSAIDDLGLTKLTVVVDIESEHGERRRIESPLRESLDSSRDASSVSDLDLSLFDLRAGDRLSAQIHGRDNRVQPFGSPQIGRSGRLDVLIVDPSTYAQAQAFLTQRQQDHESQTHASSIDLPMDSESNDEPSEQAGDFRGEQQEQDAGESELADASSAQMHGEDAGGQDTTDQGEELALDPGAKPARGDDAATDNSEFALESADLESLLSGRTLAGRPVDEPGGYDSESNRTSNDASDGERSEIVEESVTIGSMMDGVGGVAGVSLRDIPGAYRNLTRRYFERVAREAAREQPGQETRP